MPGSGDNDRIMRTVLASFETEKKVWQEKCDAESKRLKAAGRNWLTAGNNWKTSDGSYWMSVALFEMEFSDRGRSMQLEQVVVSSTYSRTSRQNKLVSRSPGIDDQLAESILAWSPSGNDLVFGKPESINFFHPDGKTLALSRSFIGERQKSRDGGRHIVSHVVVFHRDQLEGYHNNVVLLTRMLRSMGLLILQTEIPERITGTGGARQYIF